MWFGKYLKCFELDLQWVEFIFVFFQYPWCYQPLRAVYCLPYQMNDIKDNKIDLFVL